MRWRLQPYAVEAATLCDGGCNPTQVVGSAIALKLLFGLPLWALTLSLSLSLSLSLPLSLSLTLSLRRWAGCLVTVVDTLTFLLVHRLGMRYLEVFGSLLTTYYSLLTTYHLPLTTYYLLLTTYHLPLTTYYLLLTTCYLLLTTYYLLLLE